MTDDDRSEFLATLVAINEFYRQPVSPTVNAMWWDLAKDRCSLQDFRLAAATHMRTNKFPPALSEILDLARAAFWPDPEEAWNMAPKSESETAWVCQEIMVALCACQDSIDRGDMIGARKAFLESYGAQLRQASGQPTWWVSEASGGDYQTRVAAKLKCLEAAPHRRPSLNLDTKRQLEFVTGVGRSGSTELTIVNNRAKDVKGAANGQV